MAEIVLGIGSSHGPLLSTPPEQWDLRAKADRENKNHWFRGKTYDYEALLKSRAPGFAHEITVEKRRERFTEVPRRARVARQEVQRGRSRCGRDPRQRPAGVLQRGADAGDHDLSRRHDQQRSASERRCARDSTSLNRPIRPLKAPPIPARRRFADHILRSLGDENFDLAQSDETPSGAPRGGIPHAYGFFYHTILQDQTPPSVPIILNVHFPHNTPKVHRCLELGRALARAIETFDGFKRVALMASGGLTHFVIDEDFDQTVIAAMKSGDEAALAALPENFFKVGTAEIKNWIPVIAAMNAAGLKYHQVDYVPCYRSEAGTGNAMCFAYWQ